MAAMQELDMAQRMRSHSWIKLKDNRRLSYTHYGHSSTSIPPVKTLVYFHGWPSSRREPALLHHDAERLRMRIVAVDRPGAGHSSYNPRGHFHTIAADLVELLDHLGLERVVVMASSGGSPFASACAALLPGRVESLVLVCPLCPTYGREEELYEGLNANSRRIFAAFRHAPWFARTQMALVRQFMYLPQHTPLLRFGGFGPVDVEAMLENAFARKIMQAATREGLRQGIRGPFRDMMLYVTRPWQVEIESIRCPTVIWVGDADVITPPAMSRHYHRRIPGSRLNVVPGEGHLSLPFNHAGAILSSIPPAPARL